MGLAIQKILLGNAMWFIADTRDEYAVAGQRLQRDKATSLCIGDKTSLHIGLYDSIHHALVRLSVHKK